MKNTRGSTESSDGIAGMIVVLSDQIGAASRLPGQSTAHLVDVFAAQELVDQDHIPTGGRGVHQLVHGLNADDLPAVQPFGGGLGLIQQQRVC